MFSKEMADNLDYILRDRLKIMYEFNFNGLLLVCGGALKGSVMNNEIKDYDFLLLTLEKDNILDFFVKYNLTYQKIPGHGYSFCYNGYKASITATDDLANAAILSTDFLFFDVHRKQFIPIGIKKSIEKRCIYDHGYFGYPRYEQRMRLKRRKQIAKEFIQYLRGDGKKIKVIRKNKLFRRMFIGFLKKPSKIKKFFRR